MNRTRAGQRHPARGQTLVEFALVFPLALLLLVAIFDVGRAVFAYNSITNAAREAVRLAIVNQDTGRITQRGIEEAALAETAPPNVTVSFHSSVPNPDARNNAVCSQIKRGCVAVVTFQTTYRPITPIVSNILFGGGVTLSAVSMQAVEFVCPNTTLSAAQCPKQP